MITCDKCRYWEGMGNDGTNEERTGYCCRRAPRLDFNQADAGGGYTGHWPKTLENDRCGEGFQME